MCYNGSLSQHFQRFRGQWVDLIDPLIVFNTKLSVLVGAFFLYLINYLLHKLLHRDLKPPWGQTNTSAAVDSEGTRCDSHLESWLKNQRNVFALCHYERALWNTSIKSPIVTVNVKLIGLTLWEELLSYVGPLIWRVTAGYSCVPAPVLRASLQPLILLCRKPHKQYGKGTVLKLVWTRWSCSFHAKCTYKKTHLNVSDVPKSNHDKPEEKPWKDQRPANMLKMSI